MMSEIIEKCWKQITHFGGVFFYMFLVAFFYILDFQELSKKMFVALTVAYVVTVVIRLFYFKHRPKRQKYKNIIERIDASSFPSMHSMRAGIYLVMIPHFLNSLTALYFFSILGIFICLSRFIIKKHYANDIIVGFILGLIIGLIGIAYF
ncbi:phosphatase PAP2 family protein [Candidatus Woesearchaeota archaeon]|nr:phosphatase PAP2 family protein [Candidatus Woesearchaeota archaeon]